MHRDISRSKQFIAGLILSVITNLACASGFGFVMGEKPSKYGCTAMGDNPGLYTCGSAPKPHSAFESYIVRASDEHGICWVKGVGKTISDNGYGTSTRNKVDELWGVLTKAYGDSELTDRFYGSLWDGPEEWLMSIRQNERLYMHHWNNVNVPSKPLLNEVYLAVSSLGSKSGYVNLEYYSRDHQACSDSNINSESDAL